MIDLASPLTIKDKFIIFGGGFSGDYFAKSIRKVGCKALTSSRSKKNDPNSFIFNSEKDLIPEDSIFEGVTHILSCIPPDKHGNDPVLKNLKDKIKSFSLNIFLSYFLNHTLKEIKIIIIGNKIFIRWR